MNKVKSVESPDCETLPVVDESVRLRLHNLVLQQQLYRAQSNALLFQFSQTAQPRALEDKAEALTKQINAMIEEIFASVQLDPQEYRLNLEAGVFIPNSNQTK